MIEKLLERFKRIFTVQEWKREAQDAMRKKEFVIESLAELHRVEREEGGMGQVRDRANRAPTQQRQQAAPSPIRSRQQSFAGSSLAELMNAVRQQQITD